MESGLSRIRNQQVGGSNPPVGSIVYNDLRRSSLLEIISDNRIAIEFDEFGRILTPRQCRWSTSGLALPSTCRDLQTGLTEMIDE